MSVREIPKSYEYTCDCCGTVHVQENAGGHYTNSRPPRWAMLTLAQDAEDWSGAAVADGTLKLLLCQLCRGSLASSIAALVATLREKKDDGKAPANS